MLKLNPVDGAINLRGRIERLLASDDFFGANQESLLCGNKYSQSRFKYSPYNNIVEFLDFITAAIPNGDVYLFGGVLRDIALYGKRGFNSDIDLVVDGNWREFEKYLMSLNAVKNKFGGYRLSVAGWPIDIWNAKNTWAIKEGFVEYINVASLTKTTILNWDAILMNWRTKIFIYDEKYFSELNNGVLDIVLINNPNPLGMAIRVFRHLYLKEAKKITNKAAKYLWHCSNVYSYDDIRAAEYNSYSDSYISEQLYLYFKLMNFDQGDRISSDMFIVSDLIKRQYEMFV